MTENTLVNLNELPIEIQNQIKQHYEEQHQIELYRKQVEEAREITKTNQGTTVVINNNNKYFITNDVKFFRNDGTFNEKQESTLDWIMKGVGRAAGKAYAELKK